jgi:hypothetical protein
VSDLASDPVNNQDATPIAYGALPKGVPLLTRTGTRFGTVEHVLDVPEEDLFDGIVVATAHGLRFVDRDQVDEITTAYVRCALTDDEVATLPAPAGSPVYSVDALQDDGTELRDRLGRMFRRGHWTEQK